MCCCLMTVNSILRGLYTQIIPAQMNSVEIIVKIWVQIAQAYFLLQKRWVKISRRIHESHQSLRIISTCCHQRHRYYGCASVEDTHSQELQMLVECEIPHPLHDYMPFSRMSNRMKHDFFCKDGSISGLQCSSFWFNRRDDSNSATGVKHYSSLV